MHVPLFNTLRSRLIAAIVLLNILIFGGLLLVRQYHSARMVNTLAAVRVQEVGQMVTAILVHQNAKHRSDTTEELDAARNSDGLSYAVLRDSKGKVIAASGWDAAQALPSPTLLDANSDSALPAVVHVARPITLGGEPLTLHFGLSTDSWRDVLSGYADKAHAYIIGAALIGSVLLSLLVLGSTRRFSRLVRAADEGMTSGTPVQIAVDEHDEIAELARRFNHLARMVEDLRDSLRRSDDKFHAVADYTSGVEFWVNPEGKLLWINAAIQRLSGYGVDECLVMRDFPSPLATPEERDQVFATMQQALGGSSGQGLEFQALRRDGKSFWAALAWQPIADAEGRFRGVRASLHDISQLKEDRLALKRAVYQLQQSQALGQNYLARAEAERARLSALLSAMRFGVLFVDNDNTVIFHNPAFKSLWLIDNRNAVIGQPVGMVLQAAMNRPANFDLVAKLEASGIDARKELQQAQLTMNDGRIVTQHGYTVRDENGGTSGRLWLYEDVTHEHSLNERMTYLAERDPLTGLFNRHALQEQLARMMSTAERNQETLSVLYFDLDEFKYVNDTFGHGAGDDLLKRVGQEVSTQVRRDEFFARLGGDEFAILVPGATEQEISYLANRLVGCVSAIQFMVNGQTLRLSTSLGVAMFPAHAQNAEDLVAHADTAMYQAKGAGKATWRLYKADRDVSREMAIRLTWNERIQHALENNGFVLYFQGIYTAATRQVAHLEALVRMKDVDNPGGIVPPGQFIPHAEKSGRILDLDRWVIGETIRLLARKPQMPSIAVNISGRSFDETGLPEYIGELLRAHKVEPSRLMVELTETAAVSDMRDAQRFIEALCATGCTVCLDDFGAGFSSFAYLKHLRAHVLKIDGLFVRDLPNDNDSQVFVRGIASMARDMGKQTVAEFVENEETLQMLVEFGVDMVQGYYLDKPIPNHPAIDSIAIHH